MKENNKQNVVLLAHGDGGLLTSELINDIFIKQFNNPLLDRLSDAAVFNARKGRMAITTDSYVVDPVFFPGGDIGKLAVSGTVNDLAVSGACPQYITAAFILEEGFPLSDLDRIACSMAAACQEAGVSIAAGDTKVVPRGHADKVFINTSGVGIIPAGVDSSCERIKPGDRVIVNGSLGNHGLTILSVRENLGLEGALRSDCAPLNKIIGCLWEQYPRGIKVMRDLTRGGLATAAKEIAGTGGVDIYLDESLLPIDSEVRGASEILGLDPLYLANEGKFMAVVDAGEAGQVLALLRQSPYGNNAREIGEVREGDGSVYLQTAFGGTRILGLLAGSPLPRIC